MPAGGNSFDIHDWGGNAQRHVDVESAEPVARTGLEYDESHDHRRPVGHEAGTPISTTTATSTAGISSSGSGVWEFTGATNGQGDANGDGAVTAADLAIWRGTFGGEVAVTAGARRAGRCGADRVDVGRSGRGVRLADAVDAIKLPKCPRQESNLRPTV